MATVEVAIPADDPGDQFADAGIGIAVSAAGAADRARQFRIAQCGEGAGDTGQNERQYDGRPGMLCRDHTGEHENARADDAADTQHSQIKSAEATFQTRIGIDVDRFGAEQTHEFSGFEACFGKYALSARKAVRVGAIIIGHCWCTT